MSYRHGGRVPHVSPAYVLGTIYMELDEYGLKLAGRSVGVGVRNLKNLTVLHSILLGASVLRLCDDHMLLTHWTRLPWGPIIAKYTEQLVRGPTPEAFTDGRETAVPSLTICRAATVNIPE